MREFDEVDEKKKRSALRWVAAVWVLSMAYFLLTRYTVDMGGSRKSVDGYELRLWLSGATAICLAAAAMAAFAWKLSRWILLVAAALACGLLIPISFLMTVYGGWNYNPWQYLVLIAGTYSMYRIARTCAR